MRWPAQAACLFVFVVLASALVDDRQDVVFTHDEVVLAIELDLLAGVLAEQDLSPAFTSSGTRLPSSFDLAVTGGDDFALLRFFFRRVRDDDPADLLFAFLEALNNDAVVYGSDTS